MSWRERLPILIVEGALMLCAALLLALLVTGCGSASPTAPAAPVCHDVQHPAQTVPQVQCGVGGCVTVLVTTPAWTERVCR